MLILDLRLTLFLILLLPVLTVIVTLFITRWLERRRRSAHMLASLRPLLDRAPGGILLFDHRPQQLYANPYALRTLGISAASRSLPESEWASMLLDDLQQTHAAANAAGRYRTVSVPVADAGRDADAADAPARTVRWWVTRWHDWQIVFLTDATAQQHADQNARALLSDLSHELRTPLATILTHLEVLHLNNVSPEVQEQSLQFIKEEAQRLVRLGNNVLDLGRLETVSAADMRSVNLLTLINEVVMQVQPEADAGQRTLSVQADAPLPPVWGHPDGLRQVFLNLLENAIKYSRPLDQITVTVQRQADGICCQVCDTGPGIRSEHLPHITRRFYRAAPSGISGSGLGLALVVEILRQHGSQLEIDSRTTENLLADTETTGTTMRFVLPVVAENWSVDTPDASCLARPDGETTL